MDYLKRSEELFEETVENRRHLHQTPELGLELPETTAFIMEKLTEMGYDPKPCGGGVVACVGKTGGKTVLLRGDVDALPMKEESGLPFASQRENAHTCGHDIHGAMLLTAAKMLKENEAALRRNGEINVSAGRRAAHRRKIDDRGRIASRSETGRRAGVSCGCRIDADGTVCLQPGRHIDEFQ